MAIPDPARFAPTVYLHPDEKNHPEDPLIFIHASRFRHHKGGWFDQGYNKDTRQWVTGDDRGSAYYNVPVEFINSWTLHDGGKNRVPRNRNAGDEFNVFLQPNDDHREGEKQPEGKVPVFYRVRPMNGQDGLDHLIEYWFYFAYNDGPLKFNHQGDWERVHVGLKDDAPQFYSLSHHNDDTRLPPTDLEKDPAGRAIVYCALGSHAFYRAPGIYPIMLGATDSAARGNLWDTSKLLLALEVQPWRDYAGAWGEIGDPWWGDDTSGPLGPWLRAPSY